MLSHLFYQAKIVVSDLFHFIAMRVTVYRAVFRRLFQDKSGPS